MDTLARLSHWTGSFLLLIGSLRLWRNVLFLRRAHGLTALPETPPSVSVLVPARNEARTVSACLESLVRQDYPNFNVTALDDQSSDETGALLDGLAARYGNLTALHGAEPPHAGWNGKSYACQRLAEQACGEWLLFTDADTVHTASSITRGIAQAEGLGVDLLSVFPRQITQSWSERVVVSFIVDFLPLTALDLTNLWRSKAGSAAANGQYLLVRAASYRAAGGHRAVSQALVDDFALARRFRANGHRVALVDGTAMLSCRMYHNGREVWQGFSKNILLALDSAPAERRPWWWALLFAWGYAAVFVLPFVWLLFPRYRRPALLVIGWLGGLRGVVGWRLRRSPTEIVTTPLAGWSVMALGLGALFRRRRKLAVRWKDREYSGTR